MSLKVEEILNLIDIDQADPLMQQYKLALYENQKLQAQGEEQKKITLKNWIFNKLFREQALDELLEIIKTKVIVTTKTKIKSPTLATVEEKVYKWLAEQDLSNLINIHAALSTKVVKAESPIKDLSDLFEQALSFLIEFLTGKPKKGGFLAKILTMLETDQKQENPEMEFSKKEREQAYSELYAEIGPIGRKIYREGLARNFTDEQHLNKFLCVIAKDPNYKQLYTKSAHLLLSKAEKKLFKEQTPEKLAERVLANVSKAVSLACSNDTFDSSSPRAKAIKDGIYKKVRDLAVSIGVLKKQIIAVRQELSKDKETLLEDDKNKLYLLYKNLQHQRVKLLNLVAKWDAFGKGQVLSTNVDKSKQFGAQYIEQELEKFIYIQASLQEKSEMECEFRNTLKVLNLEQQQKLKGENAEICQDIMELSRIAESQKQKVKELEELIPPSSSKIKEKYEEQISDVQINRINLQISIEQIKLAYKDLINLINEERKKLTSPTTTLSTVQDNSNNNVIIQHIQLNTKIKQEQDKIKKQANQTLLLYKNSQQQQPVMRVAPTPT